MCNETRRKNNTVSEKCNSMRVRRDVEANRRLSQKPLKRRRDSVEVLFLLSSGFYLITLGLPLFLYRPIDSVGDHKSKVLRAGHIQKRRDEKQLHNRKPYHRGPNKHVGTSTRRVVFLDESTPNQYTYDPIKHDMETPDSLFLRYGSINNHNFDELQIDDSNECIPMAKWQTTSFPTCNMFHETNLFASSQVLSYDHQRVKNRLHFISYMDLINASLNTNREYNHVLLDSYETKLLGNGWFRNAWKVINVDQGINVAVKTLR